MYQEWFKEYEKLKNRGLKTMTEKEVIEKLTDNKKMTLIELIRKIKKEGMKRFIVTRPEYIYTILNLLEKKDRTIQQLKDENKTLNRQAQQYFEQGIKKDKIIYEIAKSNVKLKGYDVEETYINNTIRFYTKYIENLERNLHWRKESRKWKLKLESM